jgi:hypothetical protein
VLSSWSCAGDARGCAYLERVLSRSGAEKW